MTDSAPCPHTSLETHDAERGTLRCMRCGNIGRVERVGDVMHFVHHPQPRTQPAAPQVCVRLSPPLAEALRSKAGSRRSSELVREALSVYLASPGVICLSGEMAEQVRQAADAAGVTPKAWLEAAARERLTKAKEV